MFQETLFQALELSLPTQELKLEDLHKPKESSLTISEKRKLDGEASTFQ